MSQDIKIDPEGKALYTEILRILSQESTNLADVLESGILSEEQAMEHFAGFQITLFKASASYLARSDFSVKPSQSGMSEEEIKFAQAVSVAEILVAIAFDALGYDMQENGLFVDVSAGYLPKGEKKRAFFATSATINHLASCLLTSIHGSHDSVKTRIGQHNSKLNPDFLRGEEGQKFQDSLEEQVSGYSAALEALSRFRDALEVCQEAGAKQLQDVKAVRGVA